jgi:hypothetical protein
MFNICVTYTNLISDKRHKKSANRRINKPYQPWNVINPYDDLSPTMQPPRLPDISDTLSISTSEITDISSVYSQSISAPLSTPQGSSVFDGSSRIAPHDSISQQLGYTQGFDDEEARLQQEVAELERKQRILALRRKKEELLRSIESGESLV